MSKYALNVLAARKKDLARKHGREVETVDFLPGGICTSIFLNKETFTFSAFVGDDEFHSKNGDEVRKWARQKLKEHCALKWIPVIMVLDSAEQDTDYQYNTRKLQQHAISIDVSRHYVAKLPNGQVRMVDWIIPEENRLTEQGNPWTWIRAGALDADPDKLPVTDGRLHVLAYSEEMWAAVHQIAKGIDDLRTKLHSLLESKEGQKKLADMGSKMLLLLGAPTDS